MPFFSMYWKRVSRRPGNVILWMVVPFVFMAIYQGAFGGSRGFPKTSLAVVDYDNTPLSGFLSGALAQGPVAEFLEIVEVEDTAGVEALFASDDASAALLIPAGFSTRLLLQEPDTLVLLTNPRHSIGPKIAEGVVETFAVVGNGLLDVFSGPIERVRALADSGADPGAEEVADISRAAYTAANRTSGFASLGQTTVTIAEKKEESPIGAFNLAALFFPGLIMFGVFSASLSLETRFLTDRTDGITRRFVTAPVRPLRVAIEQRVFAATFLYAIAAVAALLGGVVWGISPSGLARSALIAAALIVFVVGFNGAVFSISNSRKAVASIASVLMMVLMIPGGAFFPAELTPEWFQHFAARTPTGMANLALTHALTGRETASVMPALLAWAGGAFLVGLFVSRRKIQ